MKYFFSSPTSHTYELKLYDVKNYLLSFHVDAKQCDQFDEPGNNIIIDSGAFSIWNSNEGEVDIEKYKQFCLSKPQHWTFINVDVIPVTGCTEKEKDVCCEKGYENYLYLKKFIKNVMPVYHYGDDIKWLHKYMQETDYIGISPANDTHETIKREFLDSCFYIMRDKVKAHGLGYSSFDGLKRYPFYSVDSISFKKVKIIHNNELITCWGNSIMVYLRKQRIRDYLEMQRVVTAIWANRGIKWEDAPQTQIIPPAKSQQKQTINKSKIPPVQARPPVQTKLSVQPKPPQLAKIPETHKLQTGIDWQQIEECEIKQTAANKTWEPELISLQNYFKNATLPKTPIIINKGQTIMDINKFITSHLITARANNGNATYFPHISRLQALKTCCENY